jgi:AcrR family transcriptional regulator
MPNRRTQAERAAETSSKILNAAQKLFSLHGFDGVSMRDIATAADVNLASLIYYFDSKQGLYTTVVLRYAVPIRDERLKALEEADANPSPEAYIRAFLEPAYNIILNAADLGGHDLARLLWRLPHEPVFILEKMLPDYENKVVAAFEKRLKSCYPEMDSRDFSWFLHEARSLFLSTLGRCAQDNALLPGEEWTHDAEFMLNRMISSLTAGLNYTYEHTIKRVKQMATA